MPQNMENQNSKKLQALTLAVYRLTDKFPEGEILKQKIRRRAMAVFENFILKDFSGIMKEIPLLSGYFLIARKQGWVKEVNFDILTRAYDKFISGLELLKERKEVSENKKKKLPLKTTSRQKRILGIIEGNKNGVEYSEILEGMGDGISRRTISGDLAELTEKRVIARRGWGRSVIYTMQNTMQK